MTKVDIFFRQANHN